jgi:hypothetical protein
MNNTIYKNILLFAFLFPPFLALSQNETRKQIDNIKHDKRFLNSTEAHAETESEAVGEALKKLACIVNMYIRDSTNLKINANQINLKDKEERLILREDGIYYVLIYVPKSVILELSGNQFPTQEMDNESPAIAPTPTTPTAIEKPSQSETSENASEWSTELTEWQIEAIEELLLCKNINAAMSKLQQMRDYFKVKRWGAGKTCPDVAKAYWIVFDANQNLVTILGPGTDKRRDFRTAQISSLDNYKNINAIWFYLAN